MFKLRIIVLILFSLKINYSHAESLNKQQNISIYSTLKAAAESDPSKTALLYKYFKNQSNSKIIEIVSDVTEGKNVGFVAEEFAHILNDRLDSSANNLGLNFGQQFLDTIVAITNGIQRGSPHEGLGIVGVELTINNLVEKIGPDGPYNMQMISPHLTKLRSLASLSGEKYQNLRAKSIHYLGKVYTLDNYNLLSNKLLSSNLIDLENAGRAFSLYIDNMTINDQKSQYLKLKNCIDNHKNNYVTINGSARNELFLIRPIIMAMASIKHPIANNYLGKLLNSTSDPDLTAALLHALSRNPSVQEMKWLVNNYYNRKGSKYSKGDAAIYSLVSENKPIVEIIFSEESSSPATVMAQLKIYQVNGESLKSNDLQKVFGYLNHSKSDIRLEVVKTLGKLNNKTDYFINLKNRLAIETDKKVVIAIKKLIGWF